jgi:hypothetical protein
MARSPLQDGPGTKNSGWNWAPQAPSRSEDALILSGSRESKFLAVNSAAYLAGDSEYDIGTIPNRNRQIDAYSAAAANAAFGFADDTMKSEMRGTISDLKREPLKTP